MASFLVKASVWCTHVQWSEVESKLRNAPLPGLFFCLFPLFKFYFSSWQKANNEITMLAKEDTWLEPIIKTPPPALRLNVFLLSSFFFFFFCCDIIHKHCTCLMITTKSFSMMPSSPTNKHKQKSIVRIYHITKTSHPAPSIPHKPIN